MSSPHPWIASYPPALRWDSEIGVRPVPQILDEACARWPDRAAIDFMGRPLSQVLGACLLYTSPSPRDRTRSRMPSSA